MKAKEFHIEIHGILKRWKIPKRMLAHGLDIAEAQLDRMLSRRTGVIRDSSLFPFDRLEILIAAASQVFSGDGTSEWLMKPNSKLCNIPPILCLRSKEELQKVLDVLAAIKHGFPK